jgi:hypothetical protein
MFGVLVPTEYPGVASSPISSAMINKIFGGFVFSIGFEGLFVGDPSELFPVSSLLHPVKVMNAKSQYI